MDTLNKLVKLHQEMFPLLKRSGLHIGSIDYVIKKLKEKHIEATYNSVKQIYDNEYKELYQIFKLPDDDNVWDKYIEYGIEGLPEQGLFADAASKLKIAWHKMNRELKELKRIKHEEEKASVTE